MDRPTSTPLAPAAAVALALTAALAAAGPRTGITGDGAAADTTPAAPPALGIDTAGFDRSVRPQDDLFRHVNGGWIEGAEIPGDQFAWGHYFRVRRDARRAVRELIREAEEADPAPGTPRRKVADLYASVVDTARRDSLGLAPIRDELERIAGAEGRADVLELVARLQRLPAQAPVEVSVGPDEGDPDRNAASLAQDGLGLPSREHYLDEGRAELRADYREHVAEMFRIAGLPDPEAAAERVLELETRLAEGQWPREKARDARARYNPLSWEEIEERTPGVEWRAFAEEAGIAGADTVIVGQPSYLEALSSALAEEPLLSWKRYLQWKVLSGFAPYLDTETARADFAFYRKRLQGVERRAPLWRRGVTTVNESLDQLVGRLYVEEHFSAEKKRRAERLVEDLREAFRRKIGDLPWMSDSTKAAARRKLSAMTAHVAYPDQWRDFSGLRIERGDLAGNMARVAAFDYRGQVDRLGEPVDEGRWQHLPQEVNGYIDNDRNVFTVTAGILQPPFFQEDATPAVNYGGVGMVIGHEISHAFDSEGRKYDHRGRLRDWWTEEDARRFRERGRALVEQFDRYSPVDTLHVDGELTLPENIADLAGVSAAYRAYRIRTEGEEPPVVGGYTGPQRFFLAYAHVWRMKIRERMMRRMLEVDPHAPVRYRVNGIVPHVDGFYEAFDVAEGDGLYRPPEERVRIW